MKYRFLLLLISLSLTILVKEQDIEFWMSPISELLFANSTYGLNGGFMISNPSNKDATVKIHYNQNETEEIITIKALGYGLKKFCSENIFAFIPVFFIIMNVSILFYHSFCGYL